MLLAQVPTELPTTTIGLFAFVILSLITIIGGGGKMISAHLTDLIKCFREDSTADRNHHKEVTAQLTQAISTGFGRVEDKVGKNNQHIRTIAAKLKVDLIEDSDG
mgnify:CR=1 FL=1